MRLTRLKTRPAFSLLEMMLAIALGMFLLLALYLTLSPHVALTEAGRESLADGEIARSVMSRIANDILNQVGPVDPRVANYSGASASATTSTGMTDATTTTDTSSIVSFNIGVKGDATTLTLSMYRVMKGPADAATNVPDPIVTSDVRRIGYWLVTNGADTVGLARQEIQQATSPDIDTALTDISEPNQFILAPEVKNVLFEYFDGSAWQQTWDGTLAPDGTTPIGPPAAIRITVTMRRSGKSATTAGDIPDDQLPTYMHVVALPTANNFAAKTNTAQ